MPDRHLWRRHITKTITFTGAAGAGAVGTVTVFTVTGRILLEMATAFCTVDLASAGGGSITFGGATDADAYIGSTTATAIDANEWWANSTPAAGSMGYVVNINGGQNVGVSYKAISENMILTITTGDVTAGAIIFDAFYTPLTDGARLS